MKKIIILIIVIIIIVYCIFYINGLNSAHTDRAHTGHAHTFWDMQPVSRTRYKTGKKSNYNTGTNVGTNTGTNVGTNTGTNVGTNTGTNVVVGVVSDEFTKFINSNYENEVAYQYTIDYLRWFLYRAIVISLRDEFNNMIGCITSKPIKLVLEHYENKTKLDVGYVDFLNIVPNHRGKRLTPLLIGEVIKATSNNQYIFKIENKPLPFDYMCKTCYYTLILNEYYQNSNKTTLSTLLSTSTPTPLFTLLTDDTPNAIKDAHIAFNSTVSKYSVYPILNADEFVHYFKHRPGIVYTYVASTNGTPTAFISIHLYSIRNSHTNDAVTDIATDIAEISYVMMSADDFREFLWSPDWRKVVAKHQIKYLLCLDIMNNVEIIKSVDFVKSADIYYHLYNIDFGGCVLDKTQMAYNL